MQQVPSSPRMHELVPYKSCDLDLVIHVAWKEMKKHVSDYPHTLMITLFELIIPFLVFF